MATSQSNWGGRKVYGKGPLPGFSKVAIGWAAALVTGVAGFGAYTGIQAIRASSWEDDAKSAQVLVAGAAGIKDRELGVLAQRERSSKIAIDNLAGREQALEFLVGRPAHQLAESRVAAIGASRHRIESAVAMEASIVKALAARSAGASASDFIGSAQLALGAVGTHKSAGRFSGPAGFASLPVAALEARARASAADADARVAKLKAALPTLAAALQADGGQAELSARVASAAAEARSISESEARAQIERYRDTVKESARKAFSREGESMGSSDWREINNDLERDPEWRQAKAGLLSAAASTAADAESIARSAWESERSHALATAALVSNQPSSMESMTVWEMAALALWAARSPGSGYQALAGREGLVAAGPAAFAKQGYSLGAEPRTGLDGKSALRLAQGDALPRPSTRFGNSSAITSLATRAAAMAGDSILADRLAASRDQQARADRMAQTQAQGRYAPASQPTPAAGSGSPKAAPSLAKTPAPSMPVVTVSSAKPAPELKWDYQGALNAGRAAEIAAKASAARSALASAERSAKASSATAADYAARQGAQRASERASSSAAERSARMAAEAASGRAVQATAKRSAEAASDKAASLAAGRAATSAAGKAATAAAGKAATSAAGKAATAAAGKAATAAAGKAATAAANRAATSAASRAATTATSRAATSSSSSRR